MKQKPRSDRELLAVLWQYVKGQQKNLLIVILFLLLNTSLAIIAPIFFREALLILESLERENTSDKALDALLVAIGAYFVITVLDWFANATQFVFTTRLNANVVKDIRIDTYRSLIDNNVQFFDENESGNLISVITNDLRELFNTGNAFALVFTSFLRLITILILLTWFSPILTLTSVLLMPIFFVVILSIRQFQRRVEKQWRTNFGKVNQSFAESMRSIAVSKSFNREEENLHQFIELNEATYQASIRRGFAIFLNRPLADFLRNVLLIALLAVGSWQVQKEGISIATFYLFIFLIDYYYDPIRALARNYTTFQSFFVNAERLVTISQNDESREKNNGNLDGASIQGNLTFQNVTFSYNSGTPVLEDISFDAKPGQRIALVGHTGAGKSTIASLLMRLYDLDAGKILLDEHDIQDFELHSLRTNISLVSQKVLLFKGTIRDNLLIADPTASDKDIWNTLAAVEAQDFIEQLPLKLDTFVEENGKNLSAGQRQMISFARALISKPKLIILDEATSAVDLYTESRIQESTEKLLEGKTSVVIAHRLTTIIRSDIIVVLEDGKVVQSGSHEQLMQTDGSYKSMYDLYFETQSAKYLEKIRTKIT
ncbi:MAG: ABC transporter ATP-binding protein [Candidatus Kariarchaeaceae archaeon]